MEWRNFVSVVPAAKKSKLGPISFQNIRVLYKQSVKKQETGQKKGKNPPKKGVFISPTSWLSFASKVGNSSLATFEAWPEKLATFEASWSEGLIKTPFLEGFCPFFVLFFAFSQTVCM